jgi:hypothetical protein
MEWISIKDKLPEKKRTAFLIVGEYGRGPHTSIAIWSDEGWEVDRDDRLCGLYPNFITHWMPLPEPPEPKPTNKEKK